MAELVVTRGGGPDAQVLFRWPLRALQVSIGHGAQHDLTLPQGAGAISVTIAQSRSGEHQLEAHGGDPVTVNGRPVKRHTLVDGDVLQLADLAITFLETPYNKERPRTLRRGGGEPVPPGRTYLEFKHRRIPVTETGVRIGSDPDNDLFLDDPHVSSHHALVVRRKGITSIQDLGSTNGTRINDVRITAGEAPATAVLDFGGVRVRLLTIEEPVQLDGHAVQRIGQLVYVDPAMEEVAQKIRAVAPQDGTVWISGQSGVGKELVAHAIHDVGPRAHKPFVAINCAALPANLVESELFGHERGAFTNADKLRVGAFEEAGEGTLFLDEIGDLPKETQAKLLRALETMTIRRVGGTGERPVHCRVLVATHQNLLDMVASGAFRMDLFQRIAGLPVAVPALAQRPRDIALLAAHLLAEAGGRATLTAGAIKKLQGHTWPGNVRELRNVLMQASVLTGHTILDAADITFQQQPAAPAAGGYQPGMTLAQVEQQVMLEALRIHGSIHAAAESLGISRNKLKRALADLPNDDGKA